MKLTKALLLSVAFAGSSAFAVGTPQSNSTCPHSNKTDTLTRTASAEMLNTVFGGGQQTAAPKKVLGNTPSTSR